MKGNYKTIKGAVDAASLAAGGDKYPCIEIHATDEGGVELVATDAYRMHLVTIPAGVVELETSDHLPARVQASELVKALKACKGADLVEIAATGYGLTVKGAGVVIELDLVSHWEIPSRSMFAGDYDTPAGVQFNAAYMADIGKAASCISNPKAASHVVFDGNKDGDTNKVSRWTCRIPGSGVALSVYLMPVRGGE